MPFLGNTLLLAPAGLAVLATLLIPVLIHLFSRSRGQRVPFGNIELVRNARRHRVTELRLTRWLLLLLRLLIIVLGALLLAGLARPGTQTLSGEVSYVSPGWWRSAPSAEREALAQQTAFFLVSGFPPLAGPEQEAPATSAAPSVHALLAERLSQVSHTGEVSAYIEGDAARMGAHLPELPTPVQWRVLPPAPWTGGADELRGLLVFGPDRLVEAALLGHALEMIRRYRLPNLQWQVASPGQAPTGGPVDWVISLTEEFPPRAWQGDAAASTRWLIEAPGPGRARERTARLPFYPHTPVTVSQVTPTPEGAEPLWVLADGTPLLVRQRTGAGQVMTFGSRFDPNWNDLLALPEFPEVLFQLLAADLDPGAAPAGTPFDARQLARATTPLHGRHQPHRALQGWLALAMTLLWVAERWLAERREASQ